MSGHHPLRSGRPIELELQEGDTVLSGKFMSNAWPELDGGLVDMGPFKMIATILQ